MDHECGDDDRPHHDTRPLRIRPEAVGALYSRSAGLLRDERNRRDRSQEEVESRAGSHDEDVPVFTREIDLPVGGDLRGAEPEPGMGDALPVDSLPRVDIVGIKDAKRLLR